jgi:DNA repair protein RecO (recombination protein O)
MFPEKARALVIRAIPFGETSSIVTLCTRELGKVRGLAKGAWRPKSGFDAALDLLSTSQVLVLQRSAGGLDLLTEACLERRFRVGTSRAAFLAAMYLAELLDAVTIESDPQPALFDAAVGGVQRLSAHPDDTGQGLTAEWVAANLVHTELAVLHAIGHAPALFRCAACGTPVAGGVRVAFGMLDGGLLCQRCRRGTRTVVSVSPDGMAALRLLAAGPDRWSGMPLPQPRILSGEVRAVMNTYVAHLVGRRLTTSRGLTESRPAFDSRRNR